jgi:hypothetical protein
LKKSPLRPLKVKAKNKKTPSKPLKVAFFDLQPLKPLKPLNLT